MLATDVQALDHALRDDLTPSPVDGVFLDCHQVYQDNRKTVMLAQIRLESGEHRQREVVERDERQVSPGQTQVACRRWCQAVRKLARAELAADPPGVFICRPERTAIVDSRLFDAKLGSYDPMETLADWQVAP